MRYLLATDSVHTTAAACDYLEEWLDPNDVVDVLSVVEPPSGGSSSGGVTPGASDTAARDAADAVNVATARLAGRASIETLSREGSPAETIDTVAAERGHDVVLVGVHGGRPGAGPGLGPVARAVVESCRCPVVVLPLPSVDS